MKKNKLVFIVSLTVLCLLLAVMSALNGSVNAQPQQGTKSQNSLKQKNSSSDSLSNYDASGKFHYLSGANDGVALDIALNFIRSHSQELGVADADLADLVVTDQYSSQHNGVTHIYLQQQYEGIRVQNGRININIAPDGSVINIGNRLVANLAQNVNTTSPVISAETAVQAAAQQLDLTLAEALVIEQAIGGTSQAAILSDGGISQNAIPVSLVYEATDDGLIRLAWNVEIYELSSLHWWTVRIDAVSGEMLSQTDYVNNEAWGDDAEIPEFTQNPDEYTVFAIPKESPYDGPRTVEVNPADATASAFGWHDTNGVTGAEFTTTQGNNVHAYTDTDANNSPDPGSSPDGGAGLVFSYTLDLALQPDTYRPAAVTNLFYWNNIIHDVMYLYGFDEASGNFQENNYGNGGSGSDYVNAEAQDGSGTNNANFATPPDGSNPRMQMFIWTNPFAQLVTVNTPITISASYVANPSNNGGTGMGLTADLEIVDDGVAPTDDGCETINNDLTGKIALMVWSQGLCNSSVFVANAAAAGALAAIIVDATPIPLTNFGGSAAIPSVAIGSTDGQLFLSTIITDGQTINATLEDNPAGTLNRDSDLDNGIIAHEYGHGISNRLTGGPNNTSCLGNAEQMGEGWSDLMALFLNAHPADTATTNRGIATYVQFAAPDGTGIRGFPYNTDMNINPDTYNSIITNGTSPHSLGQVWAAMYWEVYWNLVDKHGFNANIYDDWTTGGNNLALQLLMDGMKLQPCSPGMVDGRDAILAADQALTNGDNVCEIWAGFAKRGLGYSADQGSSGSRTDGTEAFDLPPICTGATPVIEVTPDSLSSSQFPNTQIMQTLIISNLGDLDLDWNIFEDSTPGFSGGSWSDDFDSYATGSQMHGQGGWKGWDNSPAAGALTSDVQALSAPNSVDIMNVSDLVQEYSGYNSGVWIYTAWQYIPSNYSGDQMFILLNTYSDGGAKNWSTQVRFQSASNQVLSDFDGATLPLITGQWVELRVEIDLDADVQTFYYDGQMLYQKSWVDGVSGGGAANIAAVDLWGNGGTSVYYDNMSLTRPITDCDGPDPIDWVSVNPISGTVPMTSSVSVDVTFDSSGYAAGVYTGTLCVNSNDPINPVVPVPLAMTVQELPDITITTPVSGTMLTALNGTDLDTTVEVTITNDFMMPADGHWHLWLDGMDMGPVIGYTGTVNLTVGTHVISAQLQAPDHMPLGPVDTIMVEVVGADIIITSPADGAVFTATNGVDVSVPVTVTTPNFMLPTDGHWHLWVDGTDMGPVMSESTVVSLTLGTHVISAQLQTPDHMPLGPTDSISVTVVTGVYEVFLPFVVKE